MALAWSNGHRIVTKLDVDMSVGVYEVFFDVFECVWVCVGVCGCVIRNAAMSGNCRSLV